MATFAGGFNSQQYLNQAAKAQFAEVTLIGIKESISKTGNQYLSADFQIEEGEDRGKHVFVNINHAHPTENVRAIALRTLGQIATALGKPVFEDTAELHGLSCIGRILVEPDMNGADRNTIAGFYTKDKFEELKTAGKLPALEKGASPTKSTPNVPDFGAPAAPVSAPANTAGDAGTAVPPWLKTPATGADAVTAAAASGGVAGLDDSIPF